MEDADVKDVGNAGVTIGSGKILRFPVFAQSFPHP